MASGEAATSSKPGKTSSVVQEQSSTQLYPDWSAMQAYYGSGVAIPPPYFPPNGPPAHSPHPYMWPSPIMMPPPFGAPYPLYQHAGLYAQPAEANGEAKNGGGVITGMKPCNNKDSGGANDISASARNGEENEFGCVGDATSLSESDGKHSDDGTKKKNGNKSPGIVTRENGMMIAAAVNPKLAIQVHADEGESKIEKRKQSNRESARRSRLRKQAETEELAQKVELLVAENQALKSEVNQLTQESARLLLENSGLQKKLKKAQLDADSGKSDSEASENLLSRISREH